MLLMTTQDNFTQLKAWIIANFDVVKQAMGDQVPGMYDKDSPPSTTGALTDTDGMIFRQLQRG